MAKKKTTRRRTTADSPKPEPTPEPVVEPEGDAPAGVEPDTPEEDAPPISGEGDDGVSPDFGGGSGTEYLVTER